MSFLNIHHTPKEIKYIKRFSNELPDLFNKYENIQIHKETNKIIVRINQRKFIICDNYPFWAPRVYINGIIYSSYVKTASKRILRNLEPYSNSITTCICLCCNNILHRSNWSPTYHIQKIMDEIDQINLIKRRIKYKILTEEIAEKYKLPFSIENEILQFL
jgi:hypothetical protein